MDTTMEEATSAPPSESPKIVLRESRSEARRNNDAGDGLRGSLIDVLRGLESGWVRGFAGGKREAERRARAHFEEDCVMHGQLHERSCQLPHNVRCTIAVAASPDGTMFATSHGDHTIRAYSVAACSSNALSSPPSFTFLTELRGHSRTPWTLSFQTTRPHRLVSGCLSGELRLWDVNRRSCVKTAVLGNDRVTSVCFHPTSSTVAAACGRDLFTWDVDGDEDSAPPTKRLETTIGFLCLYFHPNGKWLITCEVRSLGSGQASVGGGATTPHFCIRLRDLHDKALRPFKALDSSFDPMTVDHDLLSIVLVYSESGISISPCGRFLAVCLPPSNGTSPPGGGEAMDVEEGGGEAGPITSARGYPHGAISVLSLDDGACGSGRNQFGKTVCCAPIPRSAKVTCVRFSASSQYLLVGYGGRDARPVSVERLRRGMEVYKLSKRGKPDMSLTLVRDLTLSSDVLNAAEWQPALGGCILYGTDTGRTVCLTFSRGGRAEEGREGDGRCRSPSASDATTTLWGREGGGGGGAAVPSLPSDGAWGAS